uniref:C2H2-type domain-containing protein n=1 Tax=Heterorhabditis bacteriophora TaxID=37862 RepID=A0A1I7WA84_HETBA
MCSLRAYRGTGLEASHKCTIFALLNFTELCCNTHNTRRSPEHYLTPPHIVPHYNLTLHIPIDSLHSSASYYYCILSILVCIQVVVVYKQEEINNIVLFSLIDFINCLIYSYSFPQKEYNKYFLEIQFMSALTNEKRANLNVSWLHFTSCSYCRSLFNTITALRLHFNRNCYLHYHQHHYFFYFINSLFKNNVLLFLVGVFVVRSLFDIFSSTLHINV